MGKDTVTNGPTWFLVKKINHYYGRAGDPSDQYEINYRTIDTLYRHKSSWGGDFASRGEAIAHAEAKSWVQVKSWGEAKELARPIFDAQRAAADKVAAARDGKHLVRISIAPSDGRSYSGAAYSRWVTPEIQAVLLELLSEHDEHNVVTELGITQAYWNLPAPIEE